MYLNKAVIGGFAFNFYWSSTEHDGVDAWEQLFDNGNQYGSGKGNAGYVRAVRAF